MARIVSMCLVAVLLAGASAAFADDPFPPVWHGEWSTTYQYWDFLTNDTGSPDGLTPDGPGELVEGLPGEPYIEPGYLPSTRLWVDPNGDWIDFDSESGRQGIWPLSGVIDVLVDNHDPVNPEKWMWVQVTWRSTPGTTGEPDVFPATLPPEYTRTPVRIEDEQDYGNGWFTTLYRWEIFPNPIDERFGIVGDIWVDQLVVDTWCIPEPATLALLVMGGIAVLRKRR